MGDCRMRFNLLTEIGRKNLMVTYQYRGYKREWRLIFDDTIMPFICKIAGHKPYNPNGGLEASPEMACFRCHQFLPTESV